MAEGKEIVRMYRRILKLAQRYPSVKRDSILRDIKSDFHENKTLTDPQAIREEVIALRAGIKELSMYAGLNPANPNWAIEVGRDPLQPTAPVDGSIKAKVVGDRDEKQ